MRVLELKLRSSVAVSLFPAPARMDEPEETSYPYRTVGANGIKTPTGKEQFCVWFCVGTLVPLVRTHAPTSSAAWGCVRKIRSVNSNYLTLKTNISDFAPSVSSSYDRYTACCSLRRYGAMRTDTRVPRYSPEWVVNVGGHCSKKKTPRTYFEVCIFCVVRSFSASLCYMPPRLQQ